MPDDILRLIFLATMVERKDDELQAGGILLQRLLHGMEVTAAVGKRVLRDCHRLPGGVPFPGIEFILRADLTSHTPVNHLDEQCALFP